MGYTNINELPSEVRNSLDEDDCDVWMNAYNSKKPSTPQEIELAKKYAWEQCKELPSSFSFDIIASVEDVDSDGELITIDTIKSQMDKFIEQGGTSQDEHGNYHVATIWGYEDYTDPDTGYPGVLVHGNVFGGRGENDEYARARQDFIDGKNNLSIAGDASVEGYECDGTRCFVRRNMTTLMEISLVENPANPYAKMLWYNDKAIVKSNRIAKSKKLNKHSVYGVYVQDEFWDNNQGSYDWGGIKFYGNPEDAGRRYWELRNEGHKAGDMYLAEIDYDVLMNHPDPTFEDYEIRRFNRTELNALKPKPPAPVTIDDAKALLEQNGGSMTWDAILDSPRGSAIYDVVVDNPSIFIEDGEYYRLGKSTMFKVKSVEVHKSYNECDLQKIVKALKGYDCKVTKNGVVVKYPYEYLPIVGDNSENAKKPADFVDLVKAKIKTLGQLVDASTDSVTVDTNKRILEREFKKSYSLGECDENGILTDKLCRGRFTELFNRSLIKADDKGIWGFDGHILKYETDTFDKNIELLTDMGVARRELESALDAIWEDNDGIQDKVWTFIDDMEKKCKDIIKPYPDIMAHEYPSLYLKKKMMEIFTTAFDECKELLKNEEDEIFNYMRV